MTRNFAFKFALLSSGHPLRLPWTTLRPIGLISIVTTSLLLGFRYWGGLQAWELRAFDQLVRWRGHLAADSRLLVVGITEADLRQQNQPFLSDQIYAKLLQRLQQHQPRAIGLDVYRDLPQEPGHQALRQQLQAKNVIAITKLGGEAEAGVPAPPGMSPEQVGFNDVIADPDGVVRRILVYGTTEAGDNIYAFSYQLAKLYLAPEKVVPQFDKDDRLHWGQAIFTPLTANAGAYQKIDDAGYQILLNYRNGQVIAPELTLTEVLQGQFDPNLVQDKIVLIGNVAISAKDYFYSPYSEAANTNHTLAGVRLHAEMVSQFLDNALGQRPPFWFWPEWAELLWIASWALLGGCLSWYIRHPFWLGIAGFAAGGTIFLICLGSLWLTSWIPWVAPTLALIAAGGGVVAYKPLHDAYHDNLTGLPNWAAFVQQLKRSVDYARQGQNYLFAVLFLDLDRFKLINESLGHRNGDELLVAIARRLAMHLPQNCKLARVGGDEFTILLEEMQSLHEPGQVAEMLQTILKQPFLLNEREVFVTASLGIALGTSGYYWAEDLLRDAHTAMYHAKALGKDRSEFFNTNMRVQVISMLQMENDLRRAIEQQDFQLYYQPIVELETGKIVGFEALIRWPHPQHGLISPMKFIPLAEETGLIVPLDQWTLYEACRQLRSWQVTLPDYAHLSISVNLSGKHLSQPNLVNQIRQVLQETDIDPHCLKLEITESMVIDDLKGAIALLQELKALNIQLCVDDFGTGYSSLSYLNQFPVDTLKIDRSFVSCMGEAGENTGFVRTILSLGHELGMDVVAEGIETAMQLNQLKSLGCEYGQGYLFAKPLAIEAATELLLSNPQW